LGAFDLLKKWRTGQNNSSCPVFNL